MEGERFREIYLAPPPPEKICVAPQMSFPPPKSETWHRHWLQFAETTCINLVDKKS